MKMYHMTKLLGYSVLTTALCLMDGDKANKKGCFAGFRNRITKVFQDLKARLVAGTRKPRKKRRNRVSPKATNAAHRRPQQVVPPPTPRSSTRPVSESSVSVGSLLSNDIYLSSAWDDLRVLPGAPSPNRPPPRILSSFDQAPEWIADVIDSMEGEVPNKKTPPTYVEGKVKYECDQDGNPIKLGSGFYGSVYLVKWNGVVSALKLYKQGDFQGIYNIIYEACLLSYVSGFGITPEFYGLVGIEGDDNFQDVGILMEFIGDPDTQKSQDIFCYINTLYPSTICRTEALKVASKMVEATVTMNRLGISILDIKSDNIMLKGETEPIIIDLGVGKYKAEGKTYHLGPSDGVQSVDSFLANYNTIPPELVITGEIHHNSDAYSLCKVLQQMDEAVGLGLEDALKPYFARDPNERPPLEDLMAQLIAMSS